MSSWRPKDWVNPYRGKFGDIPIVDEETCRTDRDIYFEAGADAMLEALKSKAEIELNRRVELIINGNPDVELPEFKGALNIIDEITK